MRNLLGPIFLLAGYALVYGAVANKGRFVANPWQGFFLDAYTQQATTAILAAENLAPGATPLSPTPPPGTIR